MWFTPIFRHLNQSTRPQKWQQQSHENVRKTFAKRFNILSLTPARHTPPFNQKVNHELNQAIAPLSAERLRMPLLSRMIQTTQYAI
jgi:hypothetical protein